MAEYDLISKRALLKHLDMAIECEDCPRNINKDLHTCNMRTTFEGCTCSEVSQICCRITNFVPVADVQPVKHGKWIEKPPYKDEIVKNLEFQIVCSECDEQNCSIEFDECYNPIGKTFYKTRYCPNCGADMRGEDNDQ